MVPNVGSVVLLALTVAAVVDGQNYCSLCRDHTMCLYPGVGPKCSPRLKGGVGKTAQAVILNAHNSFRQRVAQGQVTRGSPGPQPPAANMRLMTWSAELATVAQRWADQCDFKMDECRSVTSQRNVGQAIYQSSTTNSNPAPYWAATITKWTDYVTSFNKALVASYARNNAGLYSQVAWAETYQVGCGFTMYKEAGDDELTHQFYVCNYGPGGNVAGAKMYKTGRACTKCPEGTSCTDTSFPALCA